MIEGDKFLDHYQGQTLAKLLALQPSHRIDSLVLAMESALELRRDNGEDLNAIENTVLAVEAFEREVNNGGYSQFFYNSSNEFAMDIVNCLKVIGCPELAELTQKAISILGLKELTPEAIEERMDPDDETLEDQLNALDDEFYDIEEVPAYQLFDYVKTHQQSVRL